VQQNTSRLVSDERKQLKNET